MRGWPAYRHRYDNLSATWPRFLLRVMVSAIYLGAVVTKLRLPDFANGDLLMFSLLDDRWGGGRLGMWLATQPRLLVLASFATILFEMVAARAAVDSAERGGRCWAGRRVPPGRSA